MKTLVLKCRIEKGYPFWRIVRQDWAVRNEGGAATFVESRRGALGSVCVPDRFYVRGFVYKSDSDPIMFRDRVDTDSFFDCLLLRYPTAHMVDERIVL